MYIERVRKEGGAEGGGRCHLVSLVWLGETGFRDNLPGIDGPGV